MTDPRTNPRATNFVFINIGHFFDHFFLLIFATVAALALASEWGISYARLIPYAMPGFVAFGLCSLPSGWLADKWSRQGMLTIFFIGIGASSMLASQAQTPIQISGGLLAIGLFSSIYHPVGLAMLVEGRTKTGLPLAINGVFGNLGVGGAALITGFFIDQAGWRLAFLLPGALSVLIGLVYGGWALRTRSARVAAAAAAGPGQAETGEDILDRRMLVRLFGIIFFTAALGGLIFQSSTFALPKVFDERLGELAGSATLVGWYAFMAFAVGAVAQIVVGLLVDRFSLRLIFACVAACQALFFALMIGSTGLAALLVSFGFMLAVFGQIVINDVLVARIARNEWRSRVYALRYILTLTVMASALPLIGWIHAGWGFEVLFGLLAICAGLAFTAVLMLPGISQITGLRAK